MPALLLKMLINRGNAGSYSFIPWNEEDVSIIGCKRFDVINCRKGTPKGPIFDQLGGD
jgi:hypothetical protein